MAADEVIKEIGGHPGGDLFDDFFGLGEDIVLPDKPFAAKKELLSLNVDFDDDDFFVGSGSASASRSPSSSSTTSSSANVTLNAATHFSSLAR